MSPAMSPQGAGQRGQGSCCGPGCEKMMEMEARAYPWKMGGAAVFSVLLFLALLFFVILEYQWIRLWSLRVSRESGQARPPQ